MNLPVRKAAIVLYKDDLEGLKRTIEHVKPYFNKIFIGYDHADGYESSGALFDPYGDEPVPVVDLLRDPTLWQQPLNDFKGFDAKRTYMDTLAKDYQIHVHIDTDEVWDVSVLSSLATMVTEKKPVWRSPRCNMPHGRNYPDYQTRVFWYTPDVHWVGELHEVVYRGDKPYDQWVDVGTFERPIVHLPRKIDLRRPWWETT